MLIRKITLLFRHLQTIFEGSLFTLFFSVVVDFDGEDYDGADGGDGVGDYERYVVKKDTLNHEQYRSESKHEECGEGYAISIASADCGDGLREIPEYHADGGCVADYIYYYFHYQSLVLEGHCLERSCSGIL